MHDISNRYTERTHLTQFVIHTVREYYSLDTRTVPQNMLCFYWVERHPATPQILLLHCI